MKDELRVRYDYILVGGGLQSGLVALALQHHQPQATVLMLERDDQIGGSHTWSFHLADIAKASRQWLIPLVAHSWPAYEVRLRKSSRRVELAYASITANHFSKVVGRSFEIFDTTEAAVNRLNTRANGQPWYAPNDDRGIAIVEPEAPSSRTLLTNTEAVYLTEGQVVTRCGKNFLADTVIDCRGPSSGQRVFSTCGYQKFYGFEINLSQPWPFETPVIMDDCPDQSDGFRFIYSLPFDAHRVLVEDTRFSDDPTIDRRECLANVRGYLDSHAVTEYQIVREESGVLPMPLSSELHPKATSPLAGGYAGGWFHAATGYSVPLAVAFAEAIASAPRSRSRETIEELAQQHRWRSKYARFLNLLLFRLVVPGQRYRIFDRFYRVLSDAAVARFYSHQFTVRDAARIVIGTPPTIVGLSPIRFFQSIFRGDAR